MTGKSTKNIKSRQVTLFLTRISIVSAAKVSFLFSLTISLVLFLSFLVLYFVLIANGTFQQLTDVSSTFAGAGFKLDNVISPWSILIFSAALAVTNVIMITLFTVVISALYNVIARITGGLKLTFYR